MSATKRTDLLIALFLVPCDWVLFFLAGVSAYYVRFAEVTAEIRPVIFELPLLEYVQIVSLVSLAWVGVFAFFGLYRVNGFKKRFTEIKRILIASSIGFFLIILFLFFTRELFSSRFILLAAWFLALCYVGVGRLFVRAFHHALYRRHIGIKRALVIGSGRIHDRVVQEIHHNSTLGYVVAFDYAQLSYDTQQEIFEKIRHTCIDEVIVLDSSASKNLLLTLYDICDEYHVAFSFSADFFGAISPNFYYNTISDIPIIELRRTPLFGWGRIIKRIIDIVGSFIGLVILSPLMVIIAMAIKCDSPGPVIYKNRRVSPRGEFDIYKFRYMRLEYCTGETYGGRSAQEFEEKLITERSVRTGPLYKIANDPRKTRVGVLIERASFDELPQLANVLKGDMSLVGPRPHQIREVDKYSRDHKKVFAIKPGITGMAQVSGRSDLNFDDEVQLDLFYIEHWSLILDFLILLKTPLAVLRTRHNL